MNNDLISREALKKELELSKYIIPNDLNRLLNSEINRCIEAIDNAPTVEQKHTLNDSISNIKLVCKSNNVCCVDCPMNYNCKEEPARWEVIKNETDN